MLLVKNGSTWTAVPTPDDVDLVDVIFANGAFMAVGVGTAAKVYTSSTGATWTPNTVAQYVALAFGNSTYVQLGAGINSTATGLTMNVIMPPPTTNRLFSVAYGGGRFVAVGEKGTVVTSTTGAQGSWSVITVGPTTRSLLKVIYAGTRFVAAGEKGFLYTSPDAATWTAVGPLPPGPIKALAWTGTEVLYGTDNGGIGHVP